MGATDRRSALAEMDERAAESAAVRARASGWELAASLTASLFVLPAALWAAVLGASDEWPELVAAVVVYGFPLVVWGVVVAVLVRCWRGGWRQLLGLPIVVTLGFVFPPLLLFLISKTVRQSVLPCKPGSAS